MKRRKIDLFTGFIFTTLSVIIYINIEKSHNTVITPFQPVSIMPAKPIVCLSITLFLAGLVSIIMIDYLIVNRSINGRFI